MDFAGPIERIDELEPQAEEHEQAHQAALMDLTRFITALAYDEFTHDVLARYPETSEETGVSPEQVTDSIHHKREAIRAAINEAVSNAKAALWARHDIEMAQNEILAD